MLCKLRQTPPQAAYKNLGCSLLQAAEEQRAREDLERRRQHAARVIQRRWRLYKSAKEAERKKQAAADKKNRKGSAKPASAKKK